MKNWLIYFTPTYLVCDEIARYPKEYNNMKKNWICCVVQQFLEPTLNISLFLAFLNKCITYE
jgi:hypothetical protein